MNMRAVLQHLIGRIRSSRPARNREADQTVHQDVSLASVLAGLRARRDYAREALARNPQRRNVERVVDDRVFILGLDELYRTGIKRHERGELLTAARAVASKLGVEAYSGPLEGRYSEDAGLQEYFRKVRALQEVDEIEKSRVDRMAEFKRLSQVFSSPLFGSALTRRGLLPRGIDPLTLALLTPEKWSVAALVERAHHLAVENDDCSLIGMASAARDPVAIVALLDSTVLYYEESTLGNPPVPIFPWDVSQDISRRAQRFVSTFNTVFGEELPAPTLENADLFGAAYYERAGFVGRCVNLGAKQAGKGYYHWAIYADKDGKPQIHEFWAGDIWTTGRYRGALPVGSRGKADISRNAYPH